MTIFRDDNYPKDVISINNRCVCDQCSLLINLSKIATVFLLFGCNMNSFGFRLSKVHKKTSAELVPNGIVGRNLETKQKMTSQIRPHNTIVDEFSTSLPLNFGKVNSRF